ncbi:MAG: DUF4347 domain-containing protein, partial [Nitrosospira sp.]
MPYKRPEIRRRHFVLEELEPRILYSADLSPALLQSPSLPPAEHRSIDASGEFVNLTTVQGGAIQQSRHEIVFVDTATPDYQSLIADIHSQATQDRQIDVRLLDHGRDGIAQVTQSLSGETNISAVHLLTHGNEGAVDLASTRLDFNSLIEHATQIKGWSKSLSLDAEILIYGCDVAKGSDGK